MISFHCRSVSMFLLVLFTGSINGFQQLVVSRRTGIITTASCSRINTIATSRSSTTSRNKYHTFSFPTKNHRPFLKHVSNVVVMFSIKDDTQQEQEQESSLVLSLTSCWSSSSPLNNPILATIDFAALVLFAGIGKANHDTTGGSTIDLQSTLSTAAPFLFSWYATSPFTGIYKKDDHENESSTTSHSILEAGKIAAQGWIVAIPLGCVLRGVVKGYVPPVPFVIVTMIATLIILGGARMLYAAATAATVKES
mmetsp:Transcript_12191/g.22852  ORF Transcript_12191/g.22852 Transcript_12191/m.22852 type:complete len:253 (+) Transcript_12191:138-896(+)